MRTAPIAACLAPGVGRDGAQLEGRGPTPATATAGADSAVKVHGGSRRMAHRKAVAAKAMSQGDAFTGYGEKAVGTRVELRAHFFF